MMAALKALIGKSKARLSPVFLSDHFTAPTEDCDIVMKGGVTSGIVYPYAILELAQKYRFRSVGGTSAGGIAAAFAAAAEFARAQGDPGGFARLEARCLELPGRLRSLFQAEPSLRPLMTIALAVSKGGVFGLLGAVAGALWFTVAVGILIGAGLAWLLGGGAAVMVLSAVLGILITVLARTLHLVFVGLRDNDFGLCRGIGGSAKKPALTEWLYEALQFIAFGDKAAVSTPLTFGDLEGQNIKLRMMTTNLSLRRPHALPAMIADVMFEEKRWKRLFPEPVMDHLLKVCRDTGWGARDCPSQQTMPVLVAVRMSLSFPFLISAIPMLIHDKGAEQRRADRQAEAREKGGLKTPEVEAETPPRILTPLWFSDGGLTSNFPIHFFDAPLPIRPTFALSLDDLSKGEDAPKTRVQTQMEAYKGIYLPIAEIGSVGAFAGALLGAAKDWQDTLLSGLPGQRERIVRVLLNADEGGLNLDMPVERSTALMGYGREAGVKIKSEFKFDEHRWRRGLVVYEQLERTVEATAPVWTAGFGTWLAAYKPESYKKNKGINRAMVVRRLQAFADLAGEFDPAIRDKSDLFPKPVGRLRISPDV